MPSVFKESISTVLSTQKYDPTPASAHVSHVKLQTCNYNFDIDGATTAGANFSLALGQPIPAGAVITRVFVTNTAASVGPTNLGLGIVNANDVIASTAISGAPWGVGTYNATLVNAPLTVTTSPVSSLLLTPTVAGHSAGNITFTVEYVELSSGSALR
jgi:hypothetical protein